MGIVNRYENIGKNPEKYPFGKPPDRQKILWDNGSTGTETCEKNICQTV